MTNATTTTTTLRRAPFKCAFCALDGRQARPDHISEEVRRWKRDCVNRDHEGHVVDDSGRIIEYVGCDAFRGSKSESPCNACIAISVYQRCNAEGCSRIVAICYSCADERAAFQMSVESGYCASHIDESDVDWDWRSDYDLPARRGFGTESEIAVQLTYEEMGCAIQSCIPSKWSRASDPDGQDVYTPVAVYRIGVEGDASQMRALVLGMMRGEKDTNSIDRPHFPLAIAKILAALEGVGIAAPVECVACEGYGAEVSKAIRDDGSLASYTYQLDADGNYILCDVCRGAGKVFVDDDAGTDELDGDADALDAPDPLTVDDAVQFASDARAIGRDDLARRAEAVFDVSDEERERAQAMDYLASRGYHGAPSGAQVDEPEPTCDRCRWTDEVETVVEIGVDCNRHGCVNVFGLCDDHADDLGGQYGYCVEHDDRVRLVDRDGDGVVLELTPEERAQYHAVDADEEHGSVTDGGYFGEWVGVPNLLVIGVGALERLSDDERVDPTPDGLRQTLRSAYHECLAQRMSNKMRAGIRSQLESLVSDGTIVGFEDGATGERVGSW